MDATQLSALIVAALGEVVDDIVKLLPGGAAGLPPLAKAILVAVAATLYPLLANLHLFGGSGAYAALLNGVLAYVASQVLHKATGT